MICVHSVYMAIVLCGRWLDSEFECSPRRSLREQQDTYVLLSIKFTRQVLWAVVLWPGREVSPEIVGVLYSIIPHSKTTALVLGC